MSEKYVVAYDGSPASKRAMGLALEHAKSSGASILIAHVLEWSPYSFLTPDELEERHKRRAEELDRAEQAVLEPLLKSISSKGVEVNSVIRYGHVAETLAEIAADSGASQLFIGRTGNTSLVTRVFGSVAVAMTQVAQVPCTFVP